MTNSMRDGTGDMEPALMFSFRGLDMYDRGSWPTDGALAVFEETPEMSVKERRPKMGRWWAVAFSRALRLRDDKESCRTLPGTCFGMYLLM
jgi:hypothetical protein